MKNVVINETGSASEFKPDGLYGKYLALTQKDIVREFPRRSLAARPCPACRSKKTEKAFSRLGFRYAECSVCGSVFMDPRPDDAAVKRHYLGSNSADFWRNTLAKRTEDTRREKIYEKRFLWLTELAQEYFPSAVSIADFNSKYPDLCRGMLCATDWKRKIVVNPYFHPSLLRDDEDSVFQVVDDLAAAGKAKGTADIVCAFEAIDSTCDVDLLFKSLNAMLVKGGLCFVTTISISGFDLQVLWGDSTSIFPPDRINVLSRQGLEALFRRHGFEIIEYSTPGLLDLDIVRRALAADPGLKVPRFVKTMLKDDNEQVCRDFQEFLQMSKLSSFARIALRKL